jgi:hypothetical protein
MAVITSGIRIEKSRLDAKEESEDCGHIEHHKSKVQSLHGGTK